MKPNSWICPLRKIIKHTQLSSQMLFISKTSAQTYLCVIADQILEHHHQQIPAALSFCYNTFTWGKNRNHSDASLRLRELFLSWCPMWGSSCLFWVISKPIKPLNLKNEPFCPFPPPRVWNSLTWNQLCCHSKFPCIWMSDCLNQVDD